MLSVRDYGKAVVWYRRAARKGLAIAQSNLAVLHYLGRGVKRDFEQARHWYKAAAHCMLAPFWAERLGKTTLHAHQVSARGGAVQCTVAGDRVKLAGRAVQYLEGTIAV